MSRLILIEPEATENLIENPSIEVDTDGYTTVGATLTRVLTRARFGKASGQVVTDGATVNEGIFYRIDPNSQAENYTASVYVRGEGSVRVRLRDGFNGLDFTGDAVALNDDRWTRISVSGQTGGAVTDDLRLYVETTARRAVTFYVDGLQIENKHYPTSYCDGDLELDEESHDGAMYFIWTGTEHNSTSKRSERYSRGGRDRPFDEVDTNIYPTVISGLGMAPTRLNMQLFSDQERGVVNKVKAQPRTVILTFWAKADKNSNVGTPASLARLHQARRALETFLKPDRTPNVQPMAFRYEDNGRAVDFAGFYEGGLEFDGDIRFPWHNSFPVRLLCPDPYVKDDTQDVVQLTPNKGIQGADYLVARIEGEWQIVGDTPPNNNVFAIAEAPNGDVYVGGSFTSIGGVAGTNRIARWDGQNWNALAGNGIDDNSVRDIAFGADGIVYIGGQFTLIGGITHQYITRYNPATDTFATMGADPGLSDSVFGVCVDKDGFVYVAGLFFTTRLGGTTLNCMAKYSPDANVFSSIGSGPGVDDQTLKCLVDLDGLTIYFIGKFEDEVGGVGGQGLEGICSWNGLALEALSQQGIDTETSTLLGRSMAMTKDGRLYIDGNFSHVGFKDVGAIAMWNRQEWYPLGQDGDGFTIWAPGSSETSRRVNINYKGLLFIAGDFHQATGAPLAEGLVVWNGSRFSHVDIDLPPVVRGRIMIGIGDDIWVSHANQGNADASFIHTITNTGRARAYPVLDVTGPAHLIWLENQTTGEVVKFDMKVLPDEKVVVDFREGLQKAISDLRGNVNGDIHPDSSSFSLLPGDNIVAFFADDTNSDTEISLRWGVKHWGFDDIS